jgi:hypothetical protein
MPEPAASQKRKSSTSEPSSEPLVRFTETALQDLHECLGDKLGGALPYLKLTVVLHRSAKDYAAASRRAQKQLSTLKALLRRVEKITTTLSPDTNLILERASIDMNAPLISSEPLTAREALSAAVRACAQVRARLGTPSRRRDRAAWFLPHGVARALRAVGEPLSKGRDGLFGRVLTLVWHEAEPNGSPEEVFPYLKGATDVARMLDPKLPKPARGRKTRKQK